MSTSATITLMAPDLTPINTTKPSFTLRAQKAAHIRRYTRQILPGIDVTKANEFVESFEAAIKTSHVATARNNGSHLSPPDQHTYRFPPVSGSNVTQSRLQRSFTPPSIPILRANGVRPTSSCRVTKTLSVPRRGHRRVVSVPVALPRPLSDGPRGYTFTPVASRPRESLESFLPPERYVRQNTLGLSLVVSVCGPTEQQVIVCTPGAAHAMGVEKKKGRIMKGARKVWRLFRRRPYQQVA